MYTGCFSRIEINGRLGRRFKVDKGLAQGCVLSPLLFTIYIDDLLRKLEASGVGAKVAEQLLAAL